MSVKRYWSYAGGDSSMQETETGNYVKYEDYASLERKNIELAVQLANAESKCRELAEFKSRVYAQMGAGCEAPEFSITEGLSNLRRFADTLHAIEREFFTKEVPDEECEGETVEECPLCWGMTVEQYVSEFGKCLAEVRAQGVDAAIEHLSKKFEGTGRIGVPVMALEWLAQEIRKGVQS
ncbi:hypothetical protein [Citrobacter cronae]|uniref:hypothetical protein n=1 Tax=Citrobacter cronae TaxID=1748967 RepID=UPI001F3A86BF|nr:hypothetical protein [Citrobacter cronae]